jgi:hypothetical protein
VTTVLEILEMGTLSRNELSPAAPDVTFGFASTRLDSGFNLIVDGLSSGFLLAFSGFEFRMAAISSAELVADVSILDENPTSQHLG